MRPTYRKVTAAIAAAFLAAAGAVAIGQTPANATAGAFQTSTSTAALAASSRAVSVPSGATTGDVLITNVIVSQSTMTGTTAPGGWTLACTIAGTGVSEGVWWRASTSSEPGSYTWTVPSTSSVVASMHRYSGVNTTAPIDDCQGQAAGSTGLTMTAPAVTVHGGDALIFASFGWQHAGTATPPSGYTERTDAKTAKDPTFLLAVSSETADLANGACGAATCNVAAVTATASQLSGEATGYWVGIRIALTPSVPAAPTNTVAPNISGNTETGQVLTSTTGTWVGWPTISYTYQWQDCTTSCTNISGATSSTYTLVSGDEGHRLKCLVTATSTNGASASAYSNQSRFIGEVFDNFDGSDGIITNEYAHWNYPSGTYNSSKWEVTSGCLYRDSNAAATLTPDSGATDSDGCSPYNRNNIFRMNTDATYSGDQTFWIEQFKQLDDSHNYPGCVGPDTCWYGAHAFMRHVNQYNLYYISFNRADNTAVIKRKVPCGSENLGTYFTIASASYTWTYNVFNSYKFTIHTNGSGNVELKMYDMNVSPSTPIVSGTDSGGTNPNWASTCDVSPHDGVLDAGAPAGAYSSATYTPITAAGAFGLRTDSIRWRSNDWTIAPGVL